MSITGIPQLLWIIIMIFEQWPVYTTQWKEMPKALEFPNSLGISVVESWDIPNFETIKEFLHHATSAR
jgi:hypothetical protein